MKDIELPRKVVVGENAILQIRNVVEELGLGGSSLVIADETTKEIAGYKIQKELNAEIFILNQNPEEEVKKILEKVYSENIKFIVAVGGGRVIDIAKLSSFKAKIPFISVPTAASHDGITSPQVSLKGEKPISIRAKPPLGVIADLTILRNAPQRLNASGCADVISNYTAVLDWKLAHKECGEYYGEYAAALAMMSAEIVMANAARIKDDISILIEALISSGVAIGIAGSSRPCSGSEHQFSHALDIIAPNPALHGEQCGVGCIMMAYLHNANWSKVRNSLRAIGAPVNARELGIDEKYIIQALVMAHEIRDRYTILKGGLTETEAKNLAKATLVI
ncbi:MAG: NAD(P)-dependent glycerol-1-phosphate dehydrogenase [Candidatus Altiarchaeota archaeon]